LGTVTLVEAQTLGTFRRCGTCNHQVSPSELAALVEPSVAALLPRGFVGATESPSRATASPGGDDGVSDRTTTAGNDGVGVASAPNPAVQGILLAGRSRRIGEQLHSSGMARGPAPPPPPHTHTCTHTSTRPSPTPPPLPNQTKLQGVMVAPKSAFPGPARVAAGSNFFSKVRGPVWA
jgi:hypothetical protein